MASIPEGLQNSRSEEIMNAIDCLRHLGVGKKMNITQVVVIGDQSSGKSSVLEAIAGIRFPQSIGTCTLFPTEIIMRRDKREKISLSLVSHGAPADNISLAQKSLEKHKNLKDLEQLPEIIGKLNQALGLVGGSGGPKKGFSKHTLRIEITGPDKPQLTLVDLPGLISYQGRGGKKDDVQLVQDIASSYVQNPRAIILAVISGNNDVQNQRPMALIDDHNAFKRALGVVTKLDAVEESRASLCITEVQGMGFGLGWHAVRNRATDEADITLADRDDREAEFFGGEQWNETDEDFLGIANLRTRLASALHNHLAREVPIIVDEINAKITDLDRILARIGPPVHAAKEKQIHLIDISFEFIKLATDALNGRYDDLKQRDASKMPDKALRLRASLEEHNMYFASQLRHYGAAFVFEQLWDASKTEVIPYEAGISEQYRNDAQAMQKTLTRDEAIIWAVEALRNSRGRELATSYSPGLVKDLYERLSKNWAMLAAKHVQKIDDLCKVFFEHLLKTVATEDIAQKITNHQVYPALRQRRERWNKGLERVMRIVTEPPNTQDPNFDKMQESLRRSRCDLFRRASTDEMTALGALDAAMAYYNIQLNSFVESVTKEVIGDCLLRDIAEEILSPKSVIRMSSELINKLVDEDDGVTKKRARLLKHKEEAAVVVKQLQG
ncbi:hypothetical protein LTR36_006360 [Oleoguttula mirabilis]|uniref:Uncharacterized protein n=1 Tax=Oleoguttula mirabilis TaxID=1507867 RepID=A0AAV9JUU5_9PEZI|nr:hypothetical protein LTR36_006360 [Oleoguttula mirabilis]